MGPCLNNNSNNNSNNPITIIIIHSKLGMVMLAFNPSAQKAGKGGLKQVQGQPRLHSKTPYQKKEVVG